MSNIIKSVDDVIALIIVVGCMAAIFCGIDSEVKVILGLAAEYVFLKHAAPSIASRISNTTKKS